MHDTVQYANFDFPRYSQTMATDSSGVAAALKALMAATADLSKAVTKDVGADVAEQVASALQSATDSMQAASRKVGRNPKADTRAEILEAAAALFTEKGFDAASLDEIAKKAGRTKGAIYAHFESKDDLMMALIREMTDPNTCDQQTLDVVEAYRDGTLAEYMDEAVSEADPGVLLSMEILAYALRRPERREEVAQVFIRHRDALKAVIAKEIPGAHQEAVLAFATIVNMGSLYAGLSPELADGAAIAEVLGNAVGGKTHH